MRNVWEVPESNCCLLLREHKRCAKQQHSDNCDDFYFHIFSIVRARLQTGKAVSIVTARGASMMQFVFQIHERVALVTKVIRADRRRFFHKPAEGTLSRWTFVNH